MSSFKLVSTRSTVLSLTLKQGLLPKWSTSRCLFLFHYQEKTCSDKRSSLFCATVSDKDKSFIPLASKLLMSYLPIHFPPIIPHLRVQCQ